MKQLKQKIRTRLFVTGSTLLAATLMMGVSATAFAQPKAALSNTQSAGTAWLFTNVICKTTPCSLSVAPSRR